MNYYGISGNFSDAYQVSFLPPGLIKKDYGISADLGSTYHVRSLSFAKVWNGSQLRFASVTACCVSPDTNGRNESLSQKASCVVEMQNIARSAIYFVLLVICSIFENP